MARPGYVGVGRFASLTVHVTIFQDQKVLVR